MSEKRRKWEYKAVLSGSILELRYGPSGGGFDVSFLDDDEEGGRRESNIMVSHRRLRRIINTNAGQWWDGSRARWYHPLFLTLTFAENLQDIPVANLRFMEFVKRVNYNLFHSKKALLKYSVVIEFQKRGAVHYHALLYNLKYIPNLSGLLADLWGFGFIRMNSIDNISNIGAYVTKYMTKFGLDDLGKNKKSYFNSRGLYHPLIVDDLDTILDYQSLLNKDMLLMESEYTDGSLYQRYNIKSTVLRYLNSGYPLDHTSLISDLPKEDQGKRAIQLPIHPTWFS